jgi:hypothetical protein
MPHLVIKGTRHHQKKETILTTVISLPYEKYPKNEKRQKKTH